MRITNINIGDILEDGGVVIAIHKPSIVVDSQYIINKYKIMVVGVCRLMILY